MTVDFREYPDEAILLCTLGMPHNPQEDVYLTLETTTNFKKKLGKRVYRLVDMTAFQLTFSDAMMGMGAELNREGGVNDPDVATIYIGTGEWTKFGVKAFNEQAQYGKTYILDICSNVDEAFAVARADRAKNQP